MLKTLSELSGVVFDYPYCGGSLHQYGHFDTLQGKRPLFEEPGDHIAKHFELLARQYEPERVAKEYKDVHEFLCSIVSCLEPQIAKDFWQIMEDPYPGYDVRRRITGVLLPSHIAVGALERIRYDDELTVNWEPSNGQDGGNVQ